MKVHHFQHVKKMITFANLLINKKIDKWVKVIEKPAGVKL